jgi:SAM-dependent methyltransferase
MPRIKSGDFHDYVIKDGHLIGAFDEMYQDHSDPWACSGQVGSFDNDMFLTAVRRVARPGHHLLDIGCGLGALSARMRDEVSGLTRLMACDISPDALTKARATWNGRPDRLAIEFHQMDVRDQALKFPAGFDIVTMSQLAWYVLPEFPDVLRKARAAMKLGGHLVILQVFLPPDRQLYGREYMTKPDDLQRMITSAGFTPVKNALIGIELPNNFLLIARNGA